MDPPFTAKEDIFNVENDALDLYGRLQSIGAKIVIVVFASYRVSGDKIRAQFVERIAKCNTYNPNKGGNNTGSGTHIANINFASFVGLTDFLKNNYAIDEACSQQVESSVERAFLSAQTGVR